MGDVTASHSPPKIGAPEGDFLLRALDRHAQRRRQGIPTLSVLFVEEGRGREQGGEAAWQRWLRGAGNGLRAVSVPWPRTAEDLRALASGVAPLWTPLAAGAAPSVAAAGEPVGVGDDGLAVAVDLLTTRLERGVPTGAWVCGLLVPEARAVSYLTRAPESRAKAYFREGLVAPPGRAAEPEAPADRDDDAGGPGRARAAAGRALAGILAAAAAGGVHPGALARVNAAADALDAALAQAPARMLPGTPEGGDDGARSAAERFLFAMLEAAPGTAGRFALNASLPGNVRFGNRPAEVDLLALAPRVALEVDGYHHFTDAERYRRDRRKDVLLQEQGFLVLRFLADDVVPRLETILETVRAAVARRLPRP